MICLLASLVSVVSAAPQVTAIGASGQTAIFRVFFEGSNGFGFGTTPATGSISLSLTVVDQNKNSLVSSLSSGLPGIPSGADSFSDSYRFVSAQSSTGQDSPSITVCLNTTGATSIGGLPACTSVSTFGSALFQRTTIVFQEFFTSATASCETTTPFSQQCTVTSSTPASASFGVTATQETLAQRDCLFGPVFLRGLTPSCPLRVLSNASAPTTDVFTGVPSGSVQVLGEQVALQFASTLTPSAVTLNAGTPTFNLPRSPDVFTIDTTTATVTPSGAHLNGQARTWEALVTSTSSPANVAVTVQNTFFVQIVNVAHRENETVVNGFTNVNLDATATVLIFDGSNRLFHSATISPHTFGTGFVELPVTSVTVTAYPTSTVTSSFYNGVVGNLATNKQFAPTANSYWLIVVSTNPGNSVNSPFGLSVFDVTPGSSISSGFVEEQILSFITPALSAGDSTNNVPSLSSVSILQSFTNSSSFSCSTLVTSITNPTPSQGGSTQVGVQSSPFAASALTGSVLELIEGTTSTCNSASSLATLSSVNGGTILTVPSFVTVNGNITSGCGRRVTIIAGRPYSAIEESCDDTGSSCQPQNNTVTPLVGGISFTGNQFFNVFGFNNASVAAGDQVVVLTLDIPSCSCSGGTTTIAPGCTSTACDILSAVSSLESVVTSQLHNINGTLVSVKNIDTHTQKLVKKKC